jgi:hypothetical protein
MKRKCILANLGLWRSPSCHSGLSAVSMCRGSLYIGLYGGRVSREVKLQLPGL